MQIEIENVKLSRGSHRTPEEGMCVMEAVAYVAREPHTDSPACVCPIIAQFLRTWNDDLDDAGRQRLKPYIAKVIGTRGSKALEQTRGLMLADWMLRVHTPAWFELGGMKAEADAIRALPALDSWKSLANFQPALDQARSKAAAARAAAWDAAWAAAAKKLEPTKISLQDSALQLLERLIAAKA